MKSAKLFLLLTVVSLILLSLYLAVLRNIRGLTHDVVQSEINVEQQLYREQHHSPPDNPPTDAAENTNISITTRLTRSTESISLTRSTTSPLQSSDTVNTSTPPIVVTYAKDRGVHSSVWNESACKLPNCVDLLTRQEQNRLHRCQKEAVHYLGGQLSKSTCRFMNGTKRSPVALNSQEGSGNTWLRGLLEKATGICTGFYGCDPEMRGHGFLGESIQSARVLVVKTHVHVPKWIGERSSHKFSYESSYGSGVFLIRNPAHGVIAEWNRMVTKREQGLTHTNVISKKEFETEKWIKFSGRYFDRWKERTINWVFNNHSHPVHVVSYEDLKRDTVGEVEKILDFLRFPYSHNDLVERLRQDYTVFQRPHTNDDFQHFSPEQKENLRTTLLTVMARAKACGKSDLFHFDEYLDSLSDIL